MFFLFDLDGTLTDSNGLWLEVDLEFARRRGLTVTQEYTDFVAHSIFTTAAAFTKEYYHLPDSPERIMAEWEELAYHAYLRTPAKEGVLDFLAACRRAELPMAIVTASMPRLCSAVLQQQGIAEHFRFILYAQELGMEKRNPLIWQEAARRAGCPPQQCVVFDDSPVACASARRAGCIPVGVYDDLFATAQQEVRQNSRHYLTTFAGHSPQEFFPM